MHYARTSMTKSSRTVAVHSSFQYHDAVVKYLVHVVFHKEGSKNYHSLCRTFTCIDAAERFHADCAKSLISKGYSVLCSNCKYAIGHDFY